MPKKAFANVKFKVEFDGTTWEKFAKDVALLPTNKSVQKVYKQAAQFSLNKVRTAIKKASPVGNDPDPTKVNGDPRVRMSKSVEIKVVSYKSGVIWAGVGHSTKHVPHQFMVMDGTKPHPISASGAESREPPTVMKSKPHDGGNFLGPHVKHPGAKPTKHIEKIVNDPQYVEIIGKQFGKKAVVVLKKQLDIAFINALKS